MNGRVPGRPGAVVEHTDWVCASHGTYQNITQPCPYCPPICRHPFVLILAWRDGDTTGAHVTTPPQRRWAA